MNAQLRAYHGKQSVKDFYLDRIRRHRAADELIQGTGWKDGRGCAVGCCLEAYDHSRYPVELGLPEWLAQLEDSIFEGLPREDAMAWPESFLEAIQPGVDVEPVRHKLAILRMDRLTALQQDALGKHGDAIDTVVQKVLAVIAQVRRCHEAELGGTSCDWGAAYSAADSAAYSAAYSAADSAADSAAYSAAYSARSAADSAAYSAADSARSAADSAAYSAYSAARSGADSAARSAAYSAAWKQEAVDLLRLLREATP